MGMEFNKENVSLAVSAGLELLGEGSEIDIPARLNDGVFVLKQLLLAVGKGEIALGTAVSTDSPAPED